MDSRLSPRLLALPADVRAALAGVAGPGWRVYRDHRKRLGFYAEDRPGSSCYHPEHAWWPANPAAAVAAVLGCTVRAAHNKIAARMYENRDECDDDHPAALAIIEAHVASRSAHDPR